MSNPDALTFKVGNLIHDNVCCELDSVDMVELGGDAHDSRLNDVAAQIIDLVRADEQARLCEREASRVMRGALDELDRWSEEDGSRL